MNTLTTLGFTTSSPQVAVSFPTNFSVDSYRGQNSNYSIQNHFVAHMYTADNILNQTQLTLANRNYSGLTQLIVQALDAIYIQQQPIATLTLSGIKSLNDFGNVYSGNSYSYGKIAAISASVLPNGMLQILFAILFPSNGFYLGGNLKMNSLVKCILINPPTTKTYSFSNLFNTGTFSNGGFRTVAQSRAITGAAHTDPHINGLADTFSAYAINEWEQADILSNMLEFDFISSDQSGVVAPATINSFLGSNANSIISNALLACGKLLPNISVINGALANLQSSPVASLPLQPYAGRNVKLVLQQIGNFTVNIPMLNSASLFNQIGKLIPVSPNVNLHINQGTSNSTLANTIGNDNLNLMYFTLPLDGNGNIATYDFGVPASISDIYEAQMDLIISVDIIAKKSTEVTSQLNYIKNLSYINKNLLPASFVAQFN